MLLFYLHKDQDVIQVHYDNPFRYDGSEDVVHHSLEGSRAVGHSEEHYEGFEEASVGAKGLSQTSFGHIFTNFSTIPTVSMRA